MINDRDEQLLASALLGILIGACLVLAVLVLA